MSSADKETRRALRAAGFEMERYAKGGHEIWRHQQNGATITIPSSATDISLTLTKARIRRALRQEVPK